MTFHTHRMSLFPILRCSPLATPITVTEIFVLRRLLIYRGRIRKQISLFFGARKRIQIEMFLVHAEISLSIAALRVCRQSCSMLVLSNEFERNKFITLSARPRLRHVDRNKQHGPVPLRQLGFVFALAACSRKRNVTICRPSVCPSPFVRLSVPSAYSP